jgi:hypothetical protein
MPEPDIIIPATADASQVQSWVWIDSISIDRNGTETLDTEGTEDRWRISLVCRASLAQGGQVIRDLGGREITIPSPVPSPTYDLADLAHDELVRQVIPLVRDLSIRIARGDLKPLPPPPVEPTEPTNQTNPEPTP